MKIALCTGTFVPQMNGVVSYTLDTAKALTSRGHGVIVVAPSPRRGESVDTSHYPFSVEYMPSVPGWIYPDLRITTPSLLRLTQLMKERDIQVVHLNDPSPLCVELMLAAKLLRLPVVVTFHTFYFDQDMLKTVRLGRVIGALKRPLVRLNSTFHNFADMVICPSLAAQQELKIEGLTAPSTIIHNAIDLSAVHPLSAGEITKKRSRMGIPDHAPVAMFVGRLAADKRVDVLLRAWKSVVAVYPQARLLLVGSGPKEKELRHLTLSLGMDTPVLFTGPIAREDILRRGMYHVADIYVSASRIENQSMSMLEAMAHGLPIIAVDMRGVSELVDSTNGVLTGARPSQLARAMIDVFADSDRMQELKQGALAKVQAYSITSMIDALEAVYRRLIG